MRLSDGNSQFELEILRYEFDTDLDEDPEPSPAWVIVRGVLASSDGTPLTFERSSLTTEDARRLTSWMDDVADARIEPDPVTESSPAHIFFVEPDIQAWLVARDGDRVTTRWHCEAAVVEITLVAADFAAAAAEWAENCADFPDR